MQNKRYSTTRRLVTNRPDCFDSPILGTATRFKTPVSDQKISEGGLRLRGFFKKSSEDRPLMTVVTVVYNGEKSLEKTIQSVIEQTYDNVEYIIVDGGSQDRTLDIVRKYEHAIDYWVSEPDKGTYDAMNKGIELGSGDWVNFMNSDDLFYNSTTLFDVVHFSKPLLNGVVLYGDHEVRYPDRRKTVKAGSLSQLQRGSQFCHQSTFIRLSYHKNHRYNLCRKIAADFEFFYRTFKSDKEFAYVPIVFSSISSGGISDVGRIDSILEFWSIVEKTDLLNFNYSIRIILEVLKNIFKDKFNRWRAR